MTSAFFGLDLGLRAIQTQQRALDVTNHNIANANTDGFSRQNVALTATTPWTMPAFNRSTGAGQLGTGVTASTIERARDLFADLQYRAENSTLAQAKAEHGALEELETIFNEPSSDGISSQLSAFFGAWQALAGDPSESSLRTSLVQQAAAFASSFNRAAKQLGDVQQSLNTNVSIDVDQLNGYTSQIAELNRQIVTVEVMGQRANDFRDKRDLLLDKLSALAPVTVTESADGSINVSLSGKNIVQGTTTDQLKVVTNATTGLYDVQFSSDSSAVTFTGGEFKGLLDARDVRIPSYQSKLDTIASGIITAVNALHTTGYGQDGNNGRAFFTGNSAATMAVNSVIAANPTLVGAASAPNQASNNTIALSIGQLQHSLNPTPESQYNSLVTGLGVDSAAAKNTQDNQTLLTGLLDRRRQEVSGVSIDEEMVNMVRYQKAYEASSRFITAIDQMLDKLINDTGIVGR